MTQRAGHDPRTAIAMGRRLRHQSQAKLAQLLTDEMGEDWTRVMVGNLEAGRKILDVETLMAIASIHDLPCSFYLEPIPGAGKQAKGVYMNPPVLAVA